MTVAHKPWPLAAICSLLLAVPALAANAPEKPAFKVNVDPRVELFSIIFRLAGNGEYNQGRVESYTDDVESHFGQFKDHAVVEMARKLRTTKGVSFDAPMSLAVLVKDADTLETLVPLAPWPDSLDRRWTVESVGAFLEAARQFVRDTSFGEFFEKHRPVYEIAQARMRELLDKEGHLEWFGEFFGERPGARFTVVLGMLNGGCCYGARARTADGMEDLYSILGVWMTDGAGRPRFDGSVVPTVVHEFCHSYANPFIDRHAKELEAAGERLFAASESAMRSQAYAGGKTVLYESLVRACVVRHVRRYAGEEAAQKELHQQKTRKFACVEALADALGEYESHRDRYATLESFAPRLIKAFTESAATTAEEEASRPKVVSVVPADGDENVDPGLTAIRVVFDRPMQEGSWSLVGGGPNFPEMAGKSSYDTQCTTWTCPIRLKPDWHYRFRLNSGWFQGFRSREGVPLEPVAVSFTTAKE